MSSTPMNTNPRRFDPIVPCEDPALIRAALERDPGRNLYALGDLDPAFFPRTRWWGIRSDTGRLTVALLYRGVGVPTLLLLPGPDEMEDARRLLAGLGSRLPDRVYAHLSPGLRDAIEVVEAEFHGTHMRMMWTGDPRMEPDRCAVGRLSPRGESDPVVVLGPEDEARARALYARGYPGNWFDPAMLATGHYRGLMEGETLVAIGGVHVVSAALRVAALGNITTHPEHRGRGLGGQVTRAVLAGLEGVADRIGLNVEAGHEAARRVYEREGFVDVAAYEEWSIRVR